MRILDKAQGIREMFIEKEVRIGADGMIHLAVQQGRPAVGRKDLWTDATYKDAYVCLTCDAAECEGEAKCFRQRKKEMEGRK